jgi:hypothetical protein
MVQSDAAAYTYTSYTPTPRQPTRQLGSNCSTCHKINGS